MCIICIKAAGLEMPTNETMEIMWDNNPDGAGFMYAEGGSVHIEKGFMSYEEFKNAIDELGKTHDLKKLPIIMHFRITTHGGTKPENCHPFPVSENVGMLQRLKSKAEWGLAHNGILNIIPRAGISDTMEYVVSQVAYMKKINHRFAENQNFMQMIANATTGSRIVLMNGDGNIFCTGDWVDDEATGLRYSNTNYKWSYSRSYRYDTNSLWSSYCYDDDDLDIKPTKSKSTFDKYYRSKIVYNAEDVDADIRFNGKSVNPRDLMDFYVDSSGNVYWYSEYDDAITPMDDYEVIWDDKNRNFEKAVLMDVTNEPTYLPYERLVCEYCGEDFADEYYETADGQIVCGECRQALGLAGTKID